MTAKDQNRMDKLIDIAAQALPKILAQGYDIASIQIGYSRVEFQIASGSKQPQDGVLKYPLQDYSNPETALHCKDMEGVNVWWKPMSNEMEDAA